MPRAAELPEPIRALSRRNGREISNARFNSDCLELVNTLERVLGIESEAPSKDASISDAASREGMKKDSDELRPMRLRSDLIDESATKPGVFLAHASIDK